jgi:hypothetical protein
MPQTDRYPDRSAKRSRQVFYLHGHLPVFQHKEEDLRMIAWGRRNPEIVKTS